MQENRQTSTEDSFDWTTTVSIPDSQISNYCSFTLSEPTKIVDGQKLYSQEQMIDMFRRGLEVRPQIDKITYVASIIGSVCRGVPYHILKTMDVNQTVYFPYEKWNALRSAAATLKNNYGCKFKVVKETPSKQIGRIKVTRLS